MARPAPRSVRHNLVGTVPGLLDQDQPNRILRSSTSSLFFASYDPLTAATQDVSGGINHLSVNDADKKFTPPKEIVIEIIPGRGTFWRFVPRARLDASVVDEGEFPRLVEVCDELCRMTREQWNIYKLDPMYDCFVQQPPALTIITRKSSTKPPSSTFTKPPHLFTTPAAPLLSEDLSMASAVDDYGDMMSIDGDSFIRAPQLSRRRGGPLASASSKRLKTSHPHISNPTTTDLPGQQQKLNDANQSLRSAEEDDENSLLMEEREGRTYTSNQQKRTRTMSPRSKKRAMEATRQQRERKKLQRMGERLEARKLQREQNILREVLTAMPPPQAPSASPSDIPDIKEEEDEEFEEVTAEDAEEMERLRWLEESRRKMAELEADKPLWDQAKRERERREKEEAEAIRRQKEERKRQEEERKRQEAEKIEQQKQQEETRKRRAHIEKMAKLERERQHLYRQWNSGAWDKFRAIQRYKTVSQFFDTHKFTSDDFPLTFHDIPWPTLRHPEYNNTESMDWAAVKQFFEAAQHLIRKQEYRDFLKASMSRFHPDRWRSRNLLQSIVNVQERDCVEVAVMAVSQALGSIWDEWKEAQAL